MSEEAEEELEMAFNSRNEDSLASGDSDFLEVLGQGLCAMSLAFCGPGSRGGQGAYDEIPKSKDFFSVSLRWPDCWFCSMYRCEHCV